VTTSAASENVLMAVRACQRERLLATVGHTAARTKPPLSTEEVKTILELLAGTGFLHRDVNENYGRPWYVLSERGERLAKVVDAARPEDPDVVLGRAAIDAVNEHCDLGCPMPGDAAKVGATLREQGFGR
jgi:hypothetical protein